MRYKPEQKQATRNKIVEAAGRSFKSNGFSGIGVDGLAKEAGVTSGAFYGHFKSKEAAFKETIITGLGELESAISGLIDDEGADWWEAFATFYTTQKRTCALSESCALQSLTSEVGRSSDDIREAFQTELLKIVALAGQGEAGEEKAWASLALLIGGVTLARAVKDQAISDKVSAIVKKEVLVLHES